MGRILAMVGLVFGAIFVMVNAGEFDAPLPLIIRIAGIAAIIWAFVMGILRAPEPMAIESSKDSVWGYWLAVGLEVVAIFGGIYLLNRFDHPEYSVPWIVACVGAHFLPAATFGFAPIARLGAVMVALGAVGAALTYAIGEPWNAATGVIAGFLLLGFVATQGRSAA